MSSAQPQGTATSVLPFLIIVVLIVVYRMFRNYQGVRTSEGRAIGYIIFYFAFGGFFVLTSFFEGVSYLYAIPDVIVLVLAAIWSHRFADRRITFWKNSNGSLYYKGGVIIYAIYVVGLVARISVDYIFVGPSAFTFSFTGILTGSALGGTIVTDLLLTFGIGLLVGRNARIYSRIKLIREGREKLPSTSGEYDPAR